MKRTVIAGLLAILSALLIPAAAAKNAAQKPKTEDYLLLVEQPAASDAAQSAGRTEAAAAQTGFAAQTDSGGTVRLLDGGSVQTLDETAYLTCVTLSEMPASFDPEALRAQAVAARTFAAKQAAAGKHPDADVCSDSACCQAYLSPEALRAKYGDDFAAYWDKARQAVLDTADEVLVYGGALIDATYFSCSGGSTESALAVWGSDVPYLQTVESPGEESAPKFETDVTYSAEEFKTRMEASGKVRLAGEPETWLGAATYTDGGGVAEMTVGGVLFTGTELRSLLGLNSTKFTVQYGAGGFSFDVLGYGHRVGMSQYGAEEMAENGFSYRVILRYYYRGADIKSLSQISSGQAG